MAGTQPYLVKYLFIFDILKYNLKLQVFSV